MVIHDKVSKEYFSVASWIAQHRRYDVAEGLKSVNRFVSWRMSMITVTWGRSRKNSWHTAKVKAL